jgi:hypothetical protein
MAYQIKNKPDDVTAYIPNPVYGPMGRKVTPTDTLKLQFRQATIPDREITVKNNFPKRIHDEHIKPVQVDLTPIRKIDELK